MRGQHQQTSFSQVGRKQMKKKKNKLKRGSVNRTPKEKPSDWVFGEPTEWPVSETETRLLDPHTDPFVAVC